MRKCCRSCANLVPCPRNNRYGDVDYLCKATGYFVPGVDRDISKIRRYSLGRKELKCEYKEKQEIANARYKRITEREAQ